MPPHASSHIFPPPTLRWQFPDDSVGGEERSFQVRREFSLTAEVQALLSSPPPPPLATHDPGRCTAIFCIEPSSAQEGAHTWHASLAFAAAAEAPIASKTIAGREGPPPVHLLALAARLWTKCYLTSNAHAQFSLCKVLGASLAFDGLVAQHFLTHHALHGLDELVQQALKAAAKDGDEWAAGPLAQGRLLAEVRATVDELRTVLLGTPPAFVPDAQEHEMPAWDARLATWLDRLGARSIAKDVRDRGRAAVASGGAAFWEKWLPSPTWPPLRRLVFAALALWRMRVRPMLEREARSKPLRIETVAHAGDSYTPMPKIAAPVSWAFGAPGMPAKEVGGDHYAHEPSFIEDAALLPRSWKLLPADHTRRPHQTALPVDEVHTHPSHGRQDALAALATEDQGDALPVAIAGSQGYVLSPYAAKLALLMLASPQVKAGEMARSTLGELTRLTRPEAKRLQARDHEATARGLDELHHLFIFLPDNTKVPVFQVQSPSRPELAKPDMVLRYGLTTLFGEALAQAASGQLLGPGLQGREYSGQFLLNLTGTMRLPNNKPTLLRYYMRFAAHWNAAFAPGSGGEFDRSRMPARTIEDWAAIANALPPGVIDYIEAKRGGVITKNRAPQLSMERKRALEDLAALADEHGLIEIEKQGELLRPLPPPAYLEAWRLFRAGGGRPSEPGQDI